MAEQPSHYSTASRYGGMAVHMLWHASMRENQEKSIANHQGNGGEGWSQL